MYDIILNNQQPQLLAPNAVIVSDSVEQVQFKLHRAETWKSIENIVAQFTQSGATTNVLVVNDLFYLPTEIKTGKFSLAFLGTGSTAQKNTTTSLNLTCLKAGTVEGGEPAVPPTPDLYQQLVKQVLDSEVAAKGSEDNATAAATRAETAADKAEAININPPKIQGTTWWVYDVETKQYKDTNIKAVPKDGEDGKAATIQVGTVTDLPHGTPPRVTNSGTENAAIFDFAIPEGQKGDKGDKGRTGEQGEQGIQGESGVWVSNDPPPNDSYNVWITPDQLSNPTFDDSIISNKSGWTSQKIVDYEKDEPFELIEEINVQTPVASINRVQEPNKKLYNFTGAYVEVTITDGAEIATTCNIFTKDSKFAGVHGLDNRTTQAKSMILYTNKINEVYLPLFISQRKGSTYRYELDSAINVGTFNQSSQNITRINISGGTNIPKDTNIKIYAVRAKEGEA